MKDWHRSRRARLASRRRQSFLMPGPPDRIHRLPMLWNGCVRTGARRHPAARTCSGAVAMATSLMATLTAIILTMAVMSRLPPGSPHRLARQTKYDGTTRLHSTGLHPTELGERRRAGSLGT